MADSQKMLLAGIGAASVAAVVYCLAKDDGKSKKASLASQSKDLPAGTKSKVEELDKQDPKAEHARGVMSEVTPDLKKVYAKTGGKFEGIKKVFDSLNRAPMDKDFVHEP